MSAARAAAACICLMTAGYSAAEEDSAEIAAHIFLGQVYPSGKVYLAPFPPPKSSQSDEDYLRSYRWPQAVAYQSVSAVPASANRPLPARFLSVMHDAFREISPNVRQIEAAYIPSLEFMDERHEGCAKALYRPKNPQYRYEGADFFEQVLFSCNSNEGIGVYQGKPGEVSFGVVAFDKSAKLSGVQYLNGEPRPLTRAELAEVAREKAEDAEKSDCTTTPRYLDSAASLLSAKAGGGLSLRLSRYTSPGCGGHLAEIYVLDVLKGSVPVQTRMLIRPKGVI